LPTILEKSAWIIFLSVLILSPLLFGAVHAYAYTLMIVGILTGSSLILFRGIQDGPGGKVFYLRLPAKGPGLFFSILLAYAILQIIPLPALWVKHLSPEAWIVAEKSFYPVSADDFAGGISGWLTLATYAYPVRSAILRLSAYALFFFSLVQVLNSRKRIEITVLILLVIGCFESLYGLIQAFSGSGRIWWFNKSTFNSIRDITGTYINRNHLAGLLEMLVLLAAGYVLALSGRIKTASGSETIKTPAFRKISRWLSGQERLNKRLLLLFFGVLMGIGLIFSASRGGMIAAAGGMLCMGLFLMQKKVHRRQGGVLILLFAITAAYALHIGVEYPLGRFEQFDSAFDARTRYAQKTLDLFEDYKIFGSGIGNFQYAYPKYQSREDSGLFFRYAHNDWAQFLAEAGTAGIFLLLAGGCFWGYQSIKSWHRRSDPFAVGLGLVPLAAAAAMGVHAYSDFNLHIPANFLTMTAIMAIGHNAVQLERHRDRDRLALRSYTIPMKPRGALTIAVVFGLILWNGFWTIRHFVAECHCNTVRNSTFNRDQTPPLEEIASAIAWDPGNGEYWYKMALELKHNKLPDAGSVRQNEVVRALERAVGINPFQRTYHLRLGWEYAYMWLAEPEAHQKWLIAAETAMARAAYFTGEAFPDDHMEIGNFWLMRSKTLADKSPEWWTAWNKAKWHFQQSIAMEKGPGKRHRVEKIKNEIKAHYPEESFVDRILGAAGKGPE
jgi:O-antigen ligase